VFRDSKKLRACTPNSLVRVSGVRAGVALCASLAYRADRTLKNEKEKKMKEIEFEIDKEFRRLGITPEQACEFDKSLNDATRRDINSFVSEYGNNIMGLYWGDDDDFRIMRGEELRDAKNSSVHYLFKANDLEKVRDVVRAYTEEHEEPKRLLNEIEKISVYYCFWV